MDAKQRRKLVERYRVEDGKGFRLKRYGTDDTAGLNSSQQEVAEPPPDGGGRRALPPQGVRARRRGGPQQQQAGGRGTAPRRRRTAVRHPGQALRPGPLV